MNIVGLVFGIFIVVLGVVGVATSAQRGSAASLGMWGTVAGGVLFTLAFLHGIRSRKGPDARLLLAAGIIICAVSIYNFYRIR
jgi:bacteriorhodopsin